jgi:hypothetical protein
LHQNDVAGSLDLTIFADLIVLERNPLIIAPEEIARSIVLETVDGVRLTESCGVAARAAK